MVEVRQPISQTPTDLITSFSRQSDSSVLYSYLQAHHGRSVGGWVHVDGVCLCVYILWARTHTIYNKASCRLTAIIPSFYRIRLYYEKNAEEWIILSNTSMSLI